MNADSEVHRAIRVGVTHLLTSYQYLGDTGKLDRLAQLFAPDGVLQIGDDRYVGVDGVLALFRSTSGQFADVGFLPARHHISSIYVEPQPDGSAKTLRVLPVHRHSRARSLGHLPRRSRPGRATVTAGGSRTGRVITEGFAPGSHLAPPPTT